MAATPDVLIGIDLGMTCTGMHMRFFEQIVIQQAALTEDNG